MVTDATAAATADEIEVATAEDAVLLLLELMTFAVLMLAKLCDVTTVPMLVLEAGGGGPPDGGAETEGVLLTGGCCFFLNESCKWLAGRRERGNLISLWWSCTSPEVQDRMFVIMDR